MEPMSRGERWDRIAADVNDAAVSSIFFCVVYSAERDARIRMPVVSLSARVQARRNNTMLARMITAQEDRVAEPRDQLVSIAPKIDKTFCIDSVLLSYGEQ